MKHMSATPCSTTDPAGPTSLYYAAIIDGRRCHAVTYCARLRRFNSFAGTVAAYEEHDSTPRLAANSRTAARTIELHTAAQQYALAEKHTNQCNVPLYTTIRIKP
jgi:hypothetical protein